jgi:parallel beta-helix repeat protein
MVGEAQPTLADNVCSNNTENGIAYFGQSGGTARGNTCSENMLQGIGVSEEVLPRLRGTLQQQYGDAASAIPTRLPVSRVTTSAAATPCPASSCGQRRIPCWRRTAASATQENGIAYFGTAEGTAKGEHL